MGVLREFIETTIGVLAVIVSVLIVIGVITAVTRFGCSMIGGIS